MKSTRDGHVYIRSPYKWNTMIIETAIGPPPRFNYQETTVICNVRIFMSELRIIDKFSKASRTIQSICSRNNVLFLLIIEVYRKEFLQQSRRALNYG